MKTRIYVDGESGTTGLLIHERLSREPDIERLHIDPARRHDLAERKKYLNAADVVFLCLPDDASREAVSMVENPDTRILDASTAFRCDDGWAYGFPELCRGQRDRIRTSKRVAVPGCYATGFIAAVRPLIEAGVITPGMPLSCNAVSGYSGGGRKLIAKYEREGQPAGDLLSTRLYALGLAHKHIPEMMRYGGLAPPPIFTPAVGPFAQGMLVMLPLDAEQMTKKADPAAVWKIYADYYRGERFVRVMRPDGGDALDGGYLGATALNGTNRLEIFVFGDGGRLLIVSRLDNLGKGASGQAVQCMNILLGRDEALGLE